VLRHEFQPGRLVAGAFLTLAGIIYAGDAGGAWETPWFAVIPVVVGGLCLAGAVATVTRAIRRRSGPSRPTTAPPADTQPDT
jgi:drug/metabolite transporter (DMT)-like permease